ncbi:MAG: dioxygenase [Planctomycetes bacterium]|nr:dioxygenase [Planctomycetota bacterium]
MPGPASRHPAIFLAHGAPLLLDDALWMRELAAWGRALPRPRSILMLSAHWEEAPAALSATTPVPLVYDFYGFDEKYYQVQYPAPPAPELAARVRALCSAARIPSADSQRGLDHGAWVPLVPMYPESDVPVLQLSLPRLDPRTLFALGRALAPLRDEGVLIVGSGFLTHNLRAIDWEGQAPPPRWASDFDEWTADALRRGDLDALFDYRAKAPGVRESLPTHEHFMPLFVTLGAAGETEEPTFSIEGWWLGSLTKRSVQFG